MFGEVPFQSRRLVGGSGEVIGEPARGSEQLIPHAEVSLQSRLPIEDGLVVVQPRRSDVGHVGTGWERGVVDGGVLA